MPTDTMTTSLISFGVHFAINLVAIIAITFGIHFQRHSRRDLLMAFTTFNIGLFLVMTVMSIDETALGVGFGLFAILSIIRIRSEAFSNSELAYAFIILAVALINAFGVSEQIPTLVHTVFITLLNLVAVAVVYVMDHPQLLRSVSRQQITLDTIHPNDQSLRADLEQRLNVRVLDYAIAHVDYVREITVLDVRYTTKA